MCFSFLFKQKTAYEMRISDWSSGVCSSDLYRIENGKLGAPIKGATLIGDGPSVLTRVEGIGSDFALDEGIGMCGKGGQGVPAGVGQPTLLVGGLTVGGRAEIGRAHV